jgi:hypothetical protein
MELGSQQNDFHEIWFLRRKFKFRWTLTLITGTLHEDQYTFLIISRSVLLRMRNVSDTVVEKINTHVLCSGTYFRKSCRLWNNVENYCTSGQATDENMAYAYRMLDIYSYKYTHSGCVNTHPFSAATMVARTRLIVKLYVNCLVQLSNVWLDKPAGFRVSTQNLACGCMKVDWWLRLL